MKHKNKVKINRISKILLLIITAACTVLCLSGCWVKGGIVGLSDYHYKNSENYKIGAAELSETVENIEIDWVAGKVKVTSEDKTVLSFSEESNNELTEDMKMRYLLDGTTLRIKYCKSGKWDFGQTQKTLTVSVPETWTFAKFKVCSISANADLKNIRAENADIDTVSGSINFADCSVTKQINVSTISGKTTAKLTQPLDEFDCDTTSGSLDIVALSVARFEANTISGDVDLSVQKEPDLLDIDTTSGEINLILPQNASFTLDLDTVSGDLSSDISFRKVSGDYIFGDGSKAYKINTISGDVQISTK